MSRPDDIGRFFCEFSCFDSGVANDGNNLREGHYYMFRHLYLNRISYNDLIKHRPIHYPQSTIHKLQVRDRLKNTLKPMK